MRFLGTGTGRCGTMSLARMLNLTPESEVSHEQFGPLWYGPPDQPEIIRALDWFEDCEASLIGDCSSFWLPHIPHMQKEKPDLRIVCLHRPKKETVESFLRWSGGGGNLRPIDKAEVHRDPNRQAYVNVFPTIDAADSYTSWEVYWELCERMMGQLEGPKMHLSTRDLNNDVILATLHDFLEIPEDDRIRPTKRRFNALPPPGATYATQERGETG